MPTASRKQAREVAGRLGKSQRTIWRWVAQGCDLSDERSIQQFVDGQKLRRTNVAKARERHAALGSSDSGSSPPGSPDLERLLSGKLPPPGRQGAAAALQRLEEEE